MIGQSLSHHVRRYDELIVDSGKLFEREPGFPWAYLMAALAEVAQGNFQALANLEKVPVSENTHLRGLGCAYAYCQPRSRDGGAIDSDVKKASESRFVCAYEVAHAYVNSEKRTQRSSGSKKPDSSAPTVWSGSQPSLGWTLCATIRDTANSSESSDSGPPRRKEAALNPDPPTRFRPRPRVGSRELEIFLTPMAVRACGRWIESRRPCFRESPDTVESGKQA
jgi:hypothetical protein